MNAAVAGLGVDSLSAMAASFETARIPGEIVMVDRLCERWARWAGNQLSRIGWPRSSMSAKMMEWHRLGLERETLYPAVGKDKPPEGVMLVDHAVARLPKVLRCCIETEYFSGGPAMVKAKQLGVALSWYRQNLRSAQWAIYVRLDAQLERDS